MASLSPSIDQFAEAVSQESDWYSLGIFLGAPTQELDTIGLNFRGVSITRCLIELYKCLQSRGKTPTWDFVASCLKRMNNPSLANKIKSSYITPPTCNSGTSSKSTTTKSTLDVDVPPKIAKEFFSLKTRFTKLILCIKNAFVKSRVDLSDLQHVVKSFCGSEPFSGSEATFERVFGRLEEECSIFDSHILCSIIDTFLSNNRTLTKQRKEFEKAIDMFKSSAEMGQLIGLVSKKKTSKNQVRLKVREFWSNFIVEQFEAVMKELLGTLYSHLSHMSVSKGCYCISWVTNIDTIIALKLIPQHSMEFLKIIGVISLCIEEETVYDLSGEGCEVLEAAMLQGIELRNTRAIELLLAVGCSPKVAAYNGNTVVTNIINIREKSPFSSNNGSSVDHVCILGHSEHIEAIINPSQESECSFCRLNKKMTLHLQQENDMLHLKGDMLQQKIESLENDAFQKKKDSEDSSELLKNKDAELMKLMEQLKIKDAENTLLKRELLKLNLKENEDSVKSKEKIVVSKATAVLPRQRLGIGAEMKVKVIARHSSGMVLTNGGSAVKATLTCNREECPVTDNGDGTYLVSVIPQQLGRHQLCITVNSQYVQDSPFTLDIVLQRDYTKLSNSVQVINNFEYPMYIAFSDSGEMFVTSSSDQCIHVFDKNGYERTTIGSKGSGSSKQLGKLDYHPFGLVISGEVVYVAEYWGHKIFTLTTGGTSIGTFGEEGSGIAQFNHPTDVKLSPDGKVYVSDTHNHRVQVFNPDWTLSHVINGQVSGNDKFSHPEGIAFDLSGDVHVTWHSYNSVKVFSPNGQFVRQYGNGHIKVPVAIAIDSSGYSLVTNSGYYGSLSIFDSYGKFIHSIGLRNPHGVSVSPDGSVWVTSSNDGVVKY